MSWIAVGVTVAGAAVGAYQGNEKEKAQAKRNNAAAEANRYSPWTGKTMGQDFSADGAALGGTIGGASSGLALGQGIKGMQAKPAMGTPSGQGASNMQTGSGGMVNGMGNDVNNPYASMYRPSRGSSIY